MTSETRAEEPPHPVEPPPTPPPSIGTKMGRMPRWVKGLLGTAALLVLILCGVGAHLASGVFDLNRTASRIDEAATAYRAAGMAWEAKELTPDPPVRPEDNAAPLIREAAPYVGRVDFQELQELDRLLRTGDLHSLARRLQPHERGLDLLSQAARKRRLDFGRDWDDPMATSPELLPLRHGIAALAFRAPLRARKGDLRGALADLVAARRLSVLVGQEPTNAALHARARGEFAVHDAFQRCGAAFANDPKALLALRAALAEPVPRPSLTRVLRTEAYTLLAVVRNAELFGGWEPLFGSSQDLEVPPRVPPERLRRTGLPPDTTSRAYMTRHMELWVRAKPEIDRANDDPAAIGRILARYGDVAEGPVPLSHRMDALLFPTYGAAESATLSPEAHRLATGALLEALLHRARTGAFPRRIEGLTGDWRDPYGPAPLRLKTTAHAIRIYSLGPNRRDDGGADEREYRTTGKGRQDSDLVAAFPPIYRTP